MVIINYLFINLLFKLNDFLNVDFFPFFLSSSTKSEAGDEVEEELPKVSRHYIYTKHFPLFNDDTTGQHDCNQRYVLLFGVGKERDERKHAVKKMAKGKEDLFNSLFV